MRPLAALARLGWTRPLWGGIAWIALLLVLAGLSLVFAGFPSALLCHAALLFAPSPLAGMLLLVAARHAPSGLADETGGS